jgi:hypothetical protein
MYNLPHEGSKMRLTMKSKPMAYLCADWSPYSSTGVRFLYKALDMGLTKTPFIGR